MKYFFLLNFNIFYIFDTSKFFYTYKKSLIPLKYFFKFPPIHFKIGSLIRILYFLKQLLQF